MKINSIEKVEIKTDEFFLVEVIDETYIEEVKMALQSLGISKFLIVTKEDKEKIKFKVVKEL